MKQLFFKKGVINARILTLSLYPTSCYQTIEKSLLKQAIVHLMLNDKITPQNRY